MPWHYHQLSGKIDLNGVYVDKGYSGHGPGINNPADEGIIDIGPIPEGTYSMVALQDATISGPHGPYVIVLLPDATTTKFILSLKRGPYSFLCHGGKVGESQFSGTASEGCIIMPFTTRVKMWTSKDHIIIVEKD